MSFFGIECSGSQMIFLMYIHVHLVMKKLSSGMFSNLHLFSSFDIFVLSPVPTLCLGCILLLSGGMWLVCSNLFCSGSMIWYSIVQCSVVL